MTIVTDNNRKILHKVKIFAKENNHAVKANNYTI